MKTTITGYEVQFQSLLIDRIKELLETKHLYQALEVPDSMFQPIIVQERIKRASPHGQIIETLSQAAIHSKFVPIESLDPDSPPDPNHSLNKIKRDYFSWMDFPDTIRIACDKCDLQVQPHNRSSIIPCKERPKLVNSPWLQIYSVEYLCQNCKDEPLMFLVRMEHKNKNGKIVPKLQIVGRSRLEKPCVDIALPNEEKRHFSDSVLAFNSGQTLPAIFMMRVFIEQYMRRITSIEERVTGDQLWSAYKKRLEEEFPTSGRTLGDIYNKLSECIHAADANDQLYSEYKNKVEQHFKLLEALPLKSNIC